MSKTRFERTVTIKGGCPEARMPEDPGGLEAAETPSLGSGRQRMIKAYYGLEDLRRELQVHYVFSSTGICYI